MTDIQRPEARSPRGFQDRRGGDLSAERRIIARVSEVYERWGFEGLETPAFEYVDALGKFLPDTDRPNEGVLALEDDDELPHVPDWERIEQALARIESDDRETWLTVGMALHHEGRGSEQAYEAWDDWSSASGKSPLCWNACNPLSGRPKKRKKHFRNKRIFPKRQYSISNPCWKPPRR